MASTTTIDRFGRVVIPKESRDHFGLGPGSPVTVVDSEEGILLKPGSPSAPVARKGEVLVFSGEASGDIGGLARRLREERIRRFYPRRRR